MTNRKFVQPGKLHTRFAMKALDLGEVFEANFGTTTLPGRTTRKIVLSVPEGQSTGGGTQATQSISLVPEDRPSSVASPTSTTPIGSGSVASAWTSRRPPTGSSSRRSRCSSKAAVTP